MRPAPYEADFEAYTSLPTDKAGSAYTGFLLGKDYVSNAGWAVKRAGETIETLGATVSKYILTNLAESPNNM